MQASKRTAWGTEFSFGGSVRDDRTVDTSQRRATLYIGIEQPLFGNAGPLIHTDELVRANRSLRRTLRGYEQQKADLIVEVAAAYETIVRLRHQVAFERAFAQRVDNLLRLTSARERQGRATRVDALRIELQRGEALSRLNIAEEQLAAARDEFNGLIGLPPDSDLDLEPPPLLDIGRITTESAVGAAFSNRLDYAQVLDDYTDSARALRIARRRQLPDIALVSRYERFGLGDSFSEATELDEDGWAIGLSFSREFNPGLSRADVGQAEADKQAAYAEIRIYERALARQVHQQILAYRRARAALDIADRNLKLAEGRALLARRQFEMGRGDSFAVTDAEDARVRARTQILNSRSEASLAGYRLLRVTGTLTEIPADLKPASPGDAP
jgi:outer membrane protein TolC